ncbi:MAG: HEAT repeat domain-containing protein [Acidobacteriota bacterium]|nr:HEAT repeat domain-containing protein [Acidobacteriota bacterium]
MKYFFNLKRVSSVEIAGTMPLVFRLVTALSMFFAITVAPVFVSQAQKLDVPAKVSNVTAQPSSTGTVVSIAADSSLGRAQTWQDSEGYHVVLPNAIPTASLKATRGVKVRRVGHSLEVLLQTKPGARVSMQSANNQLHVAIDSKLEPKSADYDAHGESPIANERRLFEDPESPAPRRQQSAPFKLSTPVQNLSPSSRPLETSSTPAVLSSSNATSSAPPVISSNQITQRDTPAIPETPVSEITVQPEDDGFLASVFSGTSVLVVMALGLFGLMVSRTLRSRQDLSPATEPPLSEDDECVEDQIAAGTNIQGRNAAGDVSTSLVRSGGSANGTSRAAIARMPVSGPASLYGAYRIDQEVSKLILGQPHRIDVLASRAIDDRRAIETSLIKGVNSPADDDARRRAREALNEYGFVARQCAALLLATDAFDRTTAARSLGEIKSPAALPFLLEALYDSESIVRNQAVVSIGELKLPAAIGALLDMARKHPDVPSALLSRTLSACSVEGLDFFDTVLAEPSQLGAGAVNIVDEIAHLEPTSAVEDLPANSGDPQLTKALESLNSDDAEERSEALKTLGQFRVQSSVKALAQFARYDSEPGIRSLAIAGLGSINHESVFPAVLIGMADETREVRASAARSLNRLSFDRADAYVRVIETSDDETILNVAKACIQAGIVSQNLDRLANSDHRQAYETFSLICLLAKAKMNEPVLDAIADHRNTDVRLKAVHLLACAREPETFEQLRQLAIRDGIGEEVKTALLEAMYKLDQARLKDDEAVGVLAVDSQCELEASEEEAGYRPFQSQSEPAFETEVPPSLEEFGL